MSSISRFSIEYLLSEEVKPALKRSRKDSDNKESRPSKVLKLNQSIPPQLNFQASNFHPAIRNVTVNLEGSNLWKRFHNLGTEMIVTKSGRRMFPTLQITVKGLFPTALYTFMVDFECVDNKRYRYSFHQSKWMVAGPGDAELPSRLHVHGDSPSPGEHWMKQVIAFDKIKLTNNQMDQNGHIIVNSMHRYQPNIHVIVSDSNTNTDYTYKRTFTFPETTFMAVTAYQNHRITELKIESNPFAKGFRECEIEEIQALAGLRFPLSPFFPLFKNCFQS